MIDCSKLKGRMNEICVGVDSKGNYINMESSKRCQYLRNLFPEATLEEIAQHVANQNSNPSKGIGDVVSKAIKYMTFGKISPCSSCNKRKDYLNYLVPFNNVEEIIIGDNCNRNFLMHIWPTKNSNAWKWNCDKVMKYADLFNGKRIIGIAVDNNTDHEDAVKEYMKDFTDDFIVVKNEPKIREGSTFLTMLDRVACQCDHEFTFYCHAKGSRHKNAFGNDGSTLHLWTETMYDYCLSDWNRVKESLEKHAMTGCFKRHGNFKTPGNNRWHYSGSFYWFRNKDVFSRDWNRIDRMFFAVESWPGLIFTSKETGCLFIDNCGDLYRMDYWNSSIATRLGEWHGP